MRLCTGGRCHVGFGGGIGAGRAEPDAHVGSGVVVTQGNAPVQPVQRFAIDIYAHDAVHDLVGVVDGDDVARGAVAILDGGLLPVSRQARVDEQRVSTLG